MRLCPFIAVLAAGLVLQAATAFAAEPDRCPTAAQPIETDRPDTTNSSIVVPAGSLQSENGTDVSSQSGARGLAGPESRLRFGVAPCLEVLVDLPSYFAVTGGRNPAMSSGFGDVAPAIKWQISPDPGNLDLSVTLGAALPTGKAALTGPGVQPYLQFPWSKELGGGLSLTGMLTFFTHPADPQNKLTTESTLALDKELTDSVEAFVEYVGDFSAQGAPRQIANSGLLWRVTKTQQLDMHVGFGLNNNSPRYVVGLGYSFRIDDVWKGPR
jgi:hypothetical protein